MIYLALAILLAAGSLLLDLAAASEKALEAKRSGGEAGGTSILPGLIFFPILGCILCKLIDRFFSGYGPWIVGVPGGLAIIVATAAIVRCYCLGRSIGRLK